MTAHELAKKLLEGPDWEVNIETIAYGHFGDGTKAVYFRHTDDYYFGFCESLKEVVVTSNCDHCGGYGLFGGDYCSSCGGTGKTGCRKKIPMTPTEIEEEDKEKMERAQQTDANLGCVGPNDDIPF